MQQVFSMCSMLLQRDADTRKRRLNIRRYKASVPGRRKEQGPEVGRLVSSSVFSPQVVPFSQRSGVLEWCSGTVPVGQFLVDPEKGAHKRFRPQDWSSLSCRQRMTVQLEVGPSSETRPCVTPPLSLTTGGSRVRREAPGLQRGVPELQARLQVLLHGALPGPRGVDGETAGLHPQRGHLLNRYGQMGRTLAAFENNASESATMLAFTCQNLCLIQSESE